MPELWLQETADSFWQTVGGFSSNFEEAMVFALPLTIRRLPDLTVRQTEKWLVESNFAEAGLGQIRDRRLRACLIVQGAPHNFVLLDKNDPPNEQLFSLAHEAAHFLLDYSQPRRKAQAALSPAILAVLDGLRSPTLEEQLEGLLADLSLGQYQHFMERDSTGSILNNQVLTAENRADQLALELLAPEEIALRVVQTAIQGRPSYALRLAAATRALAAAFNLPEAVAEPYAASLIRQVGGQTTFREWLNF